MSETSAIVKPILDYCEQSGILAWRNNTAGVRKIHGSYINLGKAGMPDILGVLRGGRAFACECKLPGEEPDEKQTAWLRGFALVGGFAFWVTSLDEFIEAIDKAQRGART